MSYTASIVEEAIALDNGSYEITSKSSKNDQAKETHVSTILQQQQPTQVHELEVGLRD